MRVDPPVAHVLRRIEDATVAPARLHARHLQRRPLLRACVSSDDGRSTGIELERVGGSILLGLSAPAAHDGEAGGAERAVPAHDGDPR